MEVVVVVTALAIRIGGDGGSGGGGLYGNFAGGSGNTPSTSPSQGFAGGGTGNRGADVYGAGGGGGAGRSLVKRTDGDSTRGGAGGIGVANDITGSICSIRWRRWRWFWALAPAQGGTGFSRRWCWWPCCRRN